MERAPLPNLPRVVVALKETPRVFAYLLLEAKTVDSDGRSVGLNVTRASLDAVTKYPWPHAINSLKYGVYDDDLEIFHWMRQGAPDSARCIEAQIMDWSDDVSYSVHDLEDALVAGQVDVGHFPKDLPLLHKVMVNDYGVNATQAEAAAALAFAEIVVLAITL